MLLALTCWRVCFSQGLYLKVLLFLGGVGL